MARGGSQAGAGLMEVLVVLALVGILSGLALRGLELRSTALILVQRELPGLLDHAFELAWHRGESLQVVLGHDRRGDRDTLPFPLPRELRWGLPAGVPHPPGMAPTLQAAPTGAAHVSITVTPRRTCTAGAWFLHDRSGEVLCLRLSGEGRITVLRWTAVRRGWERVNP